MLTTILLVIALIVTAILVAAALQPSEFRVTRTAAIFASPDKVFPEVNNFRRWIGWSPWERVDPDMERKYDGAAAGVGAAYGWLGNSRIGSGRMTITESRPCELIRIRLEFIKPMPCVCPAEFKFREEGDRTWVTWTMSGRAHFVGKLFSLFMSHERMIGGNFETGLANLKQIAEAAA